MSRLFGKWALENMNADPVVKSLLLGKCNWVNGNYLSALRHTLNKFEEYEQATAKQRRGNNK
jgi:hypothetical protein